MEFVLLLSHSSPLNRGSYAITWRARAVSCFSRWPCVGLSGSVPHPIRPGRETRRASEADRVVQASSARLTRLTHPAPLFSVRHCACTYASPRLLMIIPRSPLRQCRSAVGQVVWVAGCWEPGNATQPTAWTWGVGPVGWRDGAIARFVPGFLVFLPGFAFTVWL
jgi:hypothetical protein